MQKRNLSNRAISVTMHDVAKLAGVSQSTVSRVLSQSSLVIPISEETRQRVLEAVDQLSYYPNLTARSLRAQHSYMIAIMIGDISNSFYHSIVRTIQKVAHEQHYDVLIAYTEQLYENEKYFCEAMIRRPVDGIIMSPYHLTNEELDQLIKRTGASVVVLANHIDHPQIDRVYADDGQGAHEATRWLIEQKHHQRLGFIGVPAGYPPGDRRLAGFKRAVDEAGLSWNPDYFQEGDFTIESGQRAIHALLDLPQPPTAVFACNDLMAIGAINTALDRGWRIPEDIAVVGFDNIAEATIIRPNLTTVAQFPIDMGQQLAQALFERIEGVETGPQRSFEIPLQLIERQST
ncbi:MAG: LacI family DNA-binding transcriptional regulator [Chloroflexota bacterium]